MCYVCTCELYVRLHSILVVLCLLHNPSTLCRRNKFLHMLIIINSLQFHKPHNIPNKWNRDETSFLGIYMIFQIL